MNKLIALFNASVLIVVVFFYAIYPVIQLIQSGNAFYQSEFSFVYCKTKTDCRHEVGHMMDDDLGYPSKSPEFSDALIMYVYYQIKYDVLNKYTNTIISMPGLITYSENYNPGHFQSGSSPHQEIYANLYMQADGNVDNLPEIFRPFYSKDGKYDTIYSYAVDNHYYFEGVTQMKKYFEAVVAKATEHKEFLIRVGLALGGAVVGALVTNAVINSQEEFFSADEIAMGNQDNEETEESSLA